MSPLLRSELFRLNRRWMPRILLLILIGLVGLIYVLLWVAVRTSNDADAADLRDNLRLASVRDTGFSLIQQIGTVNLIILTASLIGTEFAWGTIRTILPRARGRTAFLAAKVAAAFVFLLVIVALGVAVAFGVSAVITVVEDLSGGLGPDGLTETLLAIGRLIFVMIPYLALTIFVTVWTRSSAAGIGVGLSVLFLEGLIFALIGIAGDPFDRLPGAFLARNVQAILNENVSGLTNNFSGSGDDLPPPWRAAAILAAYSIAFFGLSFSRFRSRDITVGA